MAQSQPTEENQLVAQLRKEISCLKAQNQLLLKFSKVDTFLYSQEWLEFVEEQKKIILQKQVANAQLAQEHKVIRWKNEIKNFVQAYVRQKNMKEILNQVKGTDEKHNIKTLLMVKKLRYFLQFKFISHINLLKDQIGRLRTRVSIQNKQLEQLRHQLLGSIKLKQTVKQCQAKAQLSEQFIKQMVRQNQYLKKANQKATKESYRKEVLLQTYRMPFKQ